jgi:hypothetical protein
MMAFAHLSISKRENFAGYREENAWRGAAFDCARPDRLIGAKNRDINQRTVAGGSRELPRMRILIVAPIFQPNDAQRS